jgi:dipeptidyl aminopeptidase/acylaminoacyl peptidase
MKNKPILYVLLLIPWLVQALAAQQPDGTLISRTLIESDFSASPTTLKIADEVTVEQIIYTSDGLEVEGYLIMPKVKADAPFPAIVFCRGGNRNYGSVTNYLARLARLARHGYVVVGSQYRGNGELGLEKYPGDHTCTDPRCAQAIGGHGREEFGGSDVNDVLALIPLLESLPEADAERLGIWGHSRGGMMTYLALRHTERFKGAVVVGGPSDMFASISDRPEMVHAPRELIPGWDNAERRQAAMEERSAVFWADELPEQTPILILHGTADWRVNPSQALEMSRSLLQAKRPFRLLMVEGADHSLSEYQEVYDSSVLDWFNHYVRDQAKVPSLDPHGQ